MKFLTEVEAAQRFCPWIVREAGVDRCLNRMCMAWAEAHPEIVRENHSGAEKMLRDIGIQDRGGQSIRKEGPDNSSGFVILDALGYCARTRTTDK